MLLLFYQLVTTMKIIQKIPAVAVFLALSCINFTLLGAFQPAQSGNNTNVFFRIHRVVDGDTFWLINAKGEKEKIRFIGIDAPEAKNYGKKVKQYYGKESTNFLTNYLKGKKVRLEYDVQKKDQYGRTLAYVYLEDGTFLNDYLIRNGYAKVVTFPPNVKYHKRLLASERYARQHSLGMWKEK